jgi:filamentous hemagglutinin family protein
MKANTLLTSTFVIKFAVLIAGLSVIDQSVLAQVIPDQTLSSPSVVRNLGSTATINGGTTAGPNLFHSFSLFSIPSGGTAFFNNSLAINNILTRMTGGESSLINGLIKTNGTANLFLINPNGILFGPNASLNVGGSFVASTANSFTFADGLEYSATKPQTAPLLAVNVPIGLQYGKGAQPISVVGSSLSVSPGKTLALVGGDVSLEGTTLYSPGGRIDLAGLLDSGTIGLAFNGGIPILNVFKDITQSNISLTSSTLLVEASGGGNIAMNARNIILLDSLLNAGLSSGSGGKSGDILLSASDQVTLANSYIFNSTLNPATGNGGDIAVTTKLLSLTDGSIIYVSTEGESSAGDINISVESLSLAKASTIQTSKSGSGNSGDINISASNTVSLDGTDDEGISSGIISILNKDSQGNGGDVSLFARSLVITNKALLTSITLGDGNAGNLKLSASDSVLLNGEDSIIFSTSLSPTNGNSGNVSISTNTLKLEGASINNGTNGNADSGNISIHATDTVSLDGANVGSSGIFVLTGQNSFGHGGSIDVSTGILSISNGAAIGSGSSGKGISGDIVIAASDSINLDGFGTTLLTGIFNNPTLRSEGGAGNIILNTRSLWINNGAVISAVQTGSQKTGNIAITAKDSVNILGARQDGRPSLINSQTRTSLPSGSITVFAPTLNIIDQRLVVGNRAGITAQSKGIGDAGNITINSENITVDGGEISANMGSDSIGDGGFIKIAANTLKALNGGNIRTTTISEKGGGAGSIALLLSDNLTLSGSGTGIFANTGLYSTGNGGNIFIDPPTVTITNGAAISVNSLGNGTGGSIDMRAGSLNLDNGTISAATASANGGNVTLAIQDLFLANNNGTISASAGGSGNGGNLNLNAGFLVLNNNSNITANAFQRQGGNIQITTQGLFPSRNSKITASSDLGINGTVQLTVTDPDPSRGLFSLPETVVDASGLVSQKCDATISKDSQQSEFIVTGRGGIPPNPSESIQDESILSSWVTLPHSEKSSKQAAVTIAPSKQENAEIAIAQGWKVDPDGTVVLTAEPTSVNTTPTWQPLVKCRA